MCSPMCEIMMLSPRCLSFLNTLLKTAVGWGVEGAVIESIKYRLAHDVEVIPVYESDGGTQCKDQSFKTECWGLANHRDASVKGIFVLI